MCYSVRVLTIISLISLLGCTARPPLAELEEEALVTGDWSAVERYKLMNRRMNRIDGQSVCKNGYVLQCHTKSAREVCGCITSMDRRALNVGK
jgi:hypothetical protein